MQLLFWISLFLILMNYLFYPIIIWFISLLFKKTFKSDNNFEPQISIIISAYNEEVVLEDTIENFMSLDYPKEKMEIIIGSDCSSDSTNNIILKLEEKYKGIVRGAIFNNRRGKSAVLNDLVKIAKNEILVFADANTMYKKNALKELVKYYLDERIGGVCGRLILLNNKEAIEAGNQEKLYWDIESWIKNSEGKLGILIGANGGIYSIRKNLFVQIPTTQPVMDDFYISLKILEQNKYFIYNNKAQAIEYVAPNNEIEYKRKVRNTSINISSLSFLYNLFLPKYKIIPFAFFYHKVIRWFSPIFLLVIYVSNLFLIKVNYFYQIIFILQNIFYALSLIGWILNKLKANFKIFNIPYYFVLTNIAVMNGILKVLKGQNVSYWQSTKRTK